MSASSRVGCRIKSKGAGSAGSELVSEDDLVTVLMENSVTQFCWLAFLFFFVLLVSCSDSGNREV